MNELQVSDGFFEEVKVRYEQEIQDLKYELACCRKDRGCAGNRQLNLSQIEAFDIIDVLIGTETADESSQTGEEMVGSEETCSNVQMIAMKLLKNDISELTFAEMIYLQQQVSSAVKKNCRTLGNLSPPVDGRGELIKPERNIEKEMEQTKLESQRRLFEMEMILKHERCRMYNLVESLNSVKSRNIELQFRLGTEKKLRGDVESERNELKKVATKNESKLSQMASTLEQEKDKVRIIEDQLRKEKENVKRLQEMIEEEKKVAKRCMKGKENLESMKVRLEKSIISEANLLNKIAEEKRRRELMETIMENCKKCHSSLRMIPIMLKVEGQTRAANKESRMYP